MFLKRLEMIGFKSFAKRVAIDFVPGVTAVVGPNGSGKSNVTDAIRWVLGEQSAKSLRGAKMEDIIFAGSDAQKSLNFAEVTLVLDNTDESMDFPYTEVSVTRRVHRSGDSEYLLNNHSCRLKDITDLFMDSGLGKEAFSIISQGRVDEILNSKPEDRRAIFEEAAGVLKYKLRKHKAKNKLHETDENLLRVLDILHELEVRLAPLEEQAVKAKDYQQMTAELRDFDIAVMLFDAQKYRASLQQINAQLSVAKSEESELAKQLANSEAQLQTLRQNLTAVEEKLDSEQDAYVAASTALKDYEGRQNLLTEKTQNKNQQLQKLQQNLQEQRQQEAHYAELKAEQRANFEEKRVAVTALKQEIDTLTKLLNRSAQEVDDEIETQKNRYINHLNEQATLNNEVKNISYQLTQQEAQASKASMRTAEAQNELQAIVARQTEAQKNCKQAEQALQNLRQQQQANDKALKDIRTRYDDKQQLLFKAYQHQQQLQARQQALEELENDLSGFYQGVKTVLQAAEQGKLSGIHGAIGQLIQVPPQVAQAIETALGASLQHIVTDNEKAAQHAIALLKQRKTGRATFLPRNIIRARNIATHTLQAVQTHPAFIDVASNIVNFDEDYRAIVENLLGAVIVAKDLQGATEIARLSGYKNRVVTLEGDIVNAGGSLSGGAAQRQSGIFSRKAELETLTANIAKLGEQLVTSEQMVKDAKGQMASLQQQQQKLLVAVEAQHNEVMTCQSTVRDLANNAKHITAQVSFTSIEHADNKERTEGLVAAQQKAQQRLAQIAQILVDADTQVQTLTALKERSVSEKENLREQLAAKREQYAGLEMARKHASELTATYTLNYEEAQRKVAAITQEIQWLTSDEDVVAMNPQHIAEQLVYFAEQVSQLEIIIQALRGERDEAQQQLALIESQRQHTRQRHQTLTENCHSLEVTQTRQLQNIAYLTEQLYEQYEWDIDDTSLELTIDIEAAKKRVKLLKRSIEELGDVSISAIEEFAQVKERYTFLDEQRNDLLEAQATLNEVIREMDDEMVVRFSTTFEAIRKHFKVAFRELFGGGEADLILLQPDEILTTGIEIVAQPPGKKLQNLRLLSGGERALTAIAILFAILKTRPVPFCVLDEVEAALDEANVVRYSQYLRKFSADTQFIVITHRKGTMEGADVLYGITMQESGISKLVSVKLEDY